MNLQVRRFLSPLEMRFLWSPRWVIAHVVVLAVCLACVSLGAWQLDRLAERRLANQVNAVRYEQPAIPLEEALIGSGDDVDSLEYRHVSATGVFNPEEEVLVRSQVRQSKAGFDVVTPFETDSGVLLIDRGWVPLEFDSVPVAAAPPPEGAVTVEGMVRLSGKGTSPEGQPGERQTVIRRVDVSLLDSQIEGELVPFYLQLVGSQSVAVLPVPASPPDFSDEGPHLSYAVQWFSFALVGILGYGFLIRRSLRRASPKAQPVDDFGSSEPSQVGAGESNLGRSGAGADYD